MPTPSPAPIPAEEPDSPDGWERALLDRQLEALGRLAEMGMAIAAAIQRRATAEQPETDAVLHHAALDFARVARAVRMTFALQSRLIDDFKGRTGPAEAGEADEGPPKVYWLADPPQVEQRQRVQRIVRRVALGAGLERETVERLTREAGERLENDDIYGDVMARPIRDIVALICKDLGVELDWNKFAEEAWAQGEQPPPPQAAGGGPAADPGRRPGEERLVEGASYWRPASASPVRDSS